MFDYSREPVDLLLLKTQEHSWSRTELFAVEVNDAPTSNDVEMLVTIVMVVERKLAINSEDSRALADSRSTKYLSTNIVSALSGKAAISSNMSKTLRALSLSMATKLSW